MPPANAIAAVQEKFAALTSWANKPADLWLGPAWPRNASGTLVQYGVFRMLHQGTPIDTTMGHQADERWRFRFEIYDQTPQLVLATFYGVLYGGSSPSVGAGFFKSATFTVPTGYSFKHFIVTEDPVLETLDGDFSPTGSLLVRMSWGQELWLHRDE